MHLNRYYYDQYSFFLLYLNKLKFYHVKLIELCCRVQTGFRPCTVLVGIEVIR